MNPRDASASKKTRGLSKFHFIWKSKNFFPSFSSTILVWKYLGKHHNCVCPAKTCRPAENQRFFVIFYYFIVNLILWRGGSWNLTQTPHILFRQTPRKSLKSHEAKQMSNSSEVRYFDSYMRGVHPQVSLWSMSAPAATRALEWIRMIITITIKIIISISAVIGQILFYPRETQLFDCCHLYSWHVAILGSNGN